MLKGTKHKKETIEKLRISHLGYVMPQSQKDNIKKHHLLHPNKTQFKKGSKGWNKGKKMSKKARKNMSLAHKGKKLSYYHRMKQSLGRIGEKHWNWQGGKSFEPYSIDWTETLKRSIRERDNYICGACNQYGQLVHHIDGDKNNCNPNNLVTLCKSCHTKLHNNERRKKNNSTK